MLLPVPPVTFTYAVIVIGTEPFFAELRVETYFELSLALYWFSLPFNCTRERNNFV